MGLADMVISDWVVLRGGRRVWRSVEHILTDGGGGGGVLRRGHLQQAVCGVLQRYVVKLPATSTTGGVGVSCTADIHLLTLLLNNCVKEM